MHNLKHYIIGTFKEFDDSAPKSGSRLLIAFRDFKKFGVIRWIEEYGWVVYYNPSESKVVTLSYQELQGSWYLELGKSVVETDKNITFGIEEKNETDWGNITLNEMI